MTRNKTQLITLWTRHDPSSGPSVAVVFLQAFIAVAFFIRSADFLSVTRVWFKVFPGAQTLLGRRLHLPLRKRGKAAADRV